MIGNKIFKTMKSTPRLSCLVRNSSNHVNIEKLEEESTVAEEDFIDEEARLKEEIIQKSRNKSRLNESDRRKLHEQNPYPEPMCWHHGTLRYMRKMYGCYGEASGINPSICWPTKQELFEAKDYENVKYPFTVQQMVSDAKERHRLKEEAIWARQKDIAEKLSKLNEWNQEFYDRIAKKEKEARIAKERKERLVEEVKAHFGYKVDPKDERFKEMLEKKEKEQKKAMKEERRKAKEAKAIERLLKKNKDVRSEPVQVEEDEKEKY